MGIPNFSFVAKLFITHKAIGRINIMGIAILKALKKKRAPSGALLHLFSIITGQHLRHVFHESPLL